VGSASRLAAFEAGSAAGRLGEEPLEKVSADTLASVAQTGLAGSSASAGPTGPAGKTARGGQMGPSGLPEPSGPKAAGWIRARSRAARKPCRNREGKGSRVKRSSRMAFS